MNVCDDWRGKGYSFFQNKRCEFFPCHETGGLEDFNCLFCFCPLYHSDDCGGQFTRLHNGTKDCGGCPLPHKRESYGYIIDRLKKA